MDLMELLTPEIVNTNITAKTKEGIIKQMVDKLPGDYSDTERLEILKSITERETLGSTAIGRGIALPHVRMRLIKNWSLVIAFSKEGFDFAAIDNSKTHIIFLLLQPDMASMAHLKYFSQLSMMFLNPQTLKSLLETDHENKVIQVLKQSLLSCN